MMDDLYFKFRKEKFNEYLRQNNSQKIIYEINECLKELEQLNKDIKKDDISKKIKNIVISHISSFISSNKEIKETINKKIRKLREITGNNYMDNEISLELRISLLELLGKEAIYDISSIELMVGENIISILYGF